MHYFLGFLILFVENNKEMGTFLTLDKSEKIRNYKKIKYSKMEQSSLKLYERNRNLNWTDSNKL